MLKKSKFVRLTVLACAFSACLAGACVAKTDAYVVEAADEPFYMIGASIRIGKNADDANGLRFGANVDVSLVEEVQGDENKSFGVLIFPYDEMTEAVIASLDEKEIPTLTNVLQGLIKFFREYHPGK